MLDIKSIAKWLPPAPNVLITRYSSRESLLYLMRAWCRGNRYFPDPLDSLLLPYRGSFLFASPLTIPGLWCSVFRCASWVPPGSLLLPFEGGFFAASRRWQFRDFGAEVFAAPPGYRPVRYCRLIKVTSFIFFYVLPLGAGHRPARFVDCQRKISGGLITRPYCFLQY